MRYGSDEARAWARRLRFGDVRAKSVLMALANYVDEHGASITAIPTLAEDTDQSDDSVRRRLKDLEEYGVIVRLPRWIDNNGKVNTEGRGRRSTDEIRLMFQTGQDKVDEAITKRGGGSDSEISPSQQRGPAENLALASSEGQTLASSEDRGRTAATGISIEPKKEDLPPTPLAGGFGPDSGSGEDEDDGWAEFERAFTADGVPILRHSLARPIFRAFSEPEKTLATKAATGYLINRRTEKRPAAKAAAQTFLRERDAWPSYAAYAPSERQDKPGFVPESDPFFAALSVLNVIRFGRPWPAETVPGHASRGLVTRIKPSADLLALARFYANPDQQDWFELEVAEHRNQIGAWRERVKQWTGTDLDLVRVPILDATGKQAIHRTEALGKVYELPMSKDVLRVPVEWPPRKDGSLGSGPPALADVEQAIG